MKKTHKRMIFQSILLFGALITIVAIMSQLDKVRDLFSQASYFPANFQVDTQAVLGPMPRPWRNLAQGGESHAWRLQPIAKQVASLNPEYIRIDHIYDFYDIVEGSSGNITLNFNKIDLLLDDIRSTGATPFISLSYMPTAISKSDIIDVPINYNDWQYIVQKTIEHISGTKGFSDVYYEVWNEPDLFGNWKYYGEKNYLSLYGAAARGAMNAKGVKPFKIGGPAITALYKNWIVALLNFTSKNNLKIDFISWHRYTTDLDQYKIDIHQARTWVQDFPQYDGILEFQITEWGHDSDIHAGYDGKFSAAHTVAGSISMIGTLDRAFVFEIQDGPDPAGSPYWGRWGLFTAQEHGSTAKPRFYALRLLDKIANQRLQILGQGTKVKGVAAKTDDGSIQVVMANYDIAGKHFESVPITFKNIKPGNFSLDLEYLSGNKRSLTAATTEAVLKMDVPLNANEVVFATLRQPL